MLISIILPCLNEQDNIPVIYSQLTSVMLESNDEYEIIFVDDGSTDNSMRILNKIAQTDDRVMVVEFSRNFGHQAAICAGLDHAKGDAVIMMDADLQHPPHVIPSLLQKWKDGFEVVYTVRTYPSDTPLVKKCSSRLFYKLINVFSRISIPENSADFRLLDRKVVQAFGNLKEKAVFLRGLISWIGYKQYAIHYEADSRYSGRSKYSFRHMIRFAFDGIISFSAFPLHITTFLGSIIAGFSFIYAAYAIYIRLFTNETIPGWTSVLVTVLFIGGVQLLSLGIIGEYLTRLYEEAKGRPRYLVRNIVKKNK